jgi:hypothetical protein
LVLDHLRVAVRLEDVGDDAVCPEPRHLEKGWVVDVIEKFSERLLPAEKTGVSNPPFPVTRLYVT